MALFKSFDDFIKSSQTGQSGKINESQIFEDKTRFKFDTKTAESGELGRFHFVMKIKDAEVSEVEKQAADNLQKESAISALIAKGAVFFVDIQKDTQKHFLGFEVGKTTFKGVIIAKDAANYDMAKGQPKATSTDGKFKIYDAKSEESMKKTDAQVVPSKVDAQQVVVPQVDTSGTAGSAGSAGTSGLNLDNVTANPEVLKFLQDKLLEGGGSAKVKMGAKSREVRFIQLILTEPIFAQKYGDLGKKIQALMGSVDGAYGPKTAEAFGNILDGKEGVQHQAIEAKDVEILAKYCKLMNIEVAKTNESQGLQAIWDKSATSTNGTSGTGGNSGTSGTGGNSGTSGTDGLPFVYVN